MSSTIFRLMSDGAVDLKIRVLVIRGAVGMKVVGLKEVVVAGLVITAEAIVLMSNAVRVIMIVGHLDVLVFRAVLRCTVVRQCGNFSCGAWLGLLVTGTDFFRAGRCTNGCSNEEGERWWDGCCCCSDFLGKNVFDFFVGLLQPCDIVVWALQD